MIVSRFRTTRVSDPRYEQDRLRFATFKSPALRARADVVLFVPPGAEGRAETPRVLLLHGVYGSCWSWALAGGAHRIALGMIDAKEIRPMALVMPSDGLWGDGSGYVPHSGADFERYIVEEVPELAAEVTGCAGPLFIAGLSMGGYGALRLGAKHAGRFRGISGHSSITEFGLLKQFVEEPLDLYGPVEGPSVIDWMTRNRVSLPPLRFDCGTGDPLLEPNRKLHRGLLDLAIPHEYQESGGGHDWTYWQARLPETLRFFDRLI